MPKKLTIEEAKKRALKRGLILLDDKYINKNTKMTFIDEEGYKYYLTLDVVSDKRTNKFNKVSVNNIYSIYNIQHMLDETGYGTKIISTEFHGFKDDLEFICGVCGEKFITNWDVINTTHKCTCNKCGLKRSAESHLKDKNEIRQQILDMGYKLLFDYENLHNIDVEDENGYRYHTTFYNLKNRTNKFHRFHKRNPYTLYNIKHLFETKYEGIKLSDNNIFILNETDIKNHKFNFICSKCGKEYSATLDNVRRDNRILCTKCTKRQSNIAWLVEKYLLKKNILFEKEKRFNDCKNINTLPFDFYLPKYNTVIEVNGSQHYYENELFEQSLKERKRIDKIKKDYCINNKIGYVEIPYWLIFNNREEKQTYKNIIDKILE